MLTLGHDWEIELRRKCLQQLVAEGADGAEEALRGFEEELAQWEAEAEAEIEQMRKEGYFLDSE